ncbi:MAG TPA: chaperone modulator CbpM [Sphingobacteriaceae bacterium]
MENKSMVPVELLCTHYDIEFSFIHSLQEYGLVEVTTIQEVQYIREEQIDDIERIMRLYNDLDINIEGIDVVFHLLRRVNELQNELRAVKNRLSLYED